MAVRRKLIRKIVETLLDENEIYEPPVDAEKIAEKCGLSVVRRDVESISGFIIRGEGKAVIGVNSSNAQVRQRFTIAHELGHYLLHPPGAEDVHVDSGFEVRFRDDLSSQGTDAGEQEANSFAAELLMPQKFLQTDFENVGGIDLEDGKFLEFLENIARKYKVSNQALVFRLANLGLLNSKL